MCHTRRCSLYLLNRHLNPVKRYRFKDSLAIQVSRVMHVSRVRCWSCGFLKGLCRNNAMLGAIKTIVSQHVWLIVEGSDDCRMWMTKCFTPLVYFGDVAPKSACVPVLWCCLQTLTGEWTLKSSDCYHWTSCLTRWNVKMLMFVTTLCRHGWHFFGFIFTVTLRDLRFVFKAVWVPC